MKQLHLFGESIHSAVCGKGEHAKPTRKMVHDL
jgi:hypothetical protein